MNLYSILIAYYYRLCYYHRYYYVKAREANIFLL
jgi:hypothetical protein